MNELGLFRFSPGWLVQQFLAIDSWNDILNVNSREIITTPTPGGAILMTDFNEQRALDGLQKFDYQSIGEERTADQLARLVVCHGF